MLVVLIVPVKTIGARGFPEPGLSRRSPRLSSLSAGILTMTPLRQRFIEDLQLRNRSPKTIEVYVYHGREVARHFKQSTVSLFQFPVPMLLTPHIQAFAADLFGVAPSALQVGHLVKDAVWTLDADHRAHASVAATAEYGTPRANGTWL